MQRNLQPWATRTRAVLAATALLATVTVTPALATAPAAAPAGVTAAVTPTAVRTGVLAGPAEELLNRLNAERAAAGVPALAADPSLSAVAQGWSGTMAATGDFRHNPYVSGQIPAGWQSWGENVAWNSPADAARMHAQWMGSTGHRANMLNGQFTHVGIGWVVDGSGRAWGTQVFARYPSGAALPRFYDVPLSHRFHGDIEWAATSGVASGYADGGYRPSSGVSRQAMAAFLYRTVQGGSDPTCSGSTRVFRDVPASSPFCGVVEWLARSGIVSGYPDGTFRPTATVTREATAAFLHRAAGGTSGPCSGSAFRDVPSGSAFCSSVQWLASAGISGGFDDGTFRPAEQVSRQAMAAFLHRAD